jgi:nitroimidazol reductase NimA-like FMN-containing flavoprotein (pyridoxamine 5'-phosphate oxidase superfamily)
VKPAQNGQIDDRFSQDGTVPMPWEEVEGLLERAELYWISTVRPDGRPHVTPLIATLHDGAMHFSTGLREQKAHNIEQNPKVALTTGRNDWAGGVDVVVEGRAARVTGRERLQAIADGIEAKYGSVWHFDVEGDEGFESVGGLAAVFRIEASKVLAFAKDPYSQTTFRL